MRLIARQRVAILDWAQKMCIERLSDELHLAIQSYLDLGDLLSLSSTCRSQRDIIRDEGFMQKLHSLPVRSAKGVRRRVNLISSFDRERQKAAYMKLVRDTPADPESVEELEMHVTRWARAVGTEKADGSHNGQQSASVDKQLHALQAHAELCDESKARISNARFDRLAASLFNQGRSRNFSRSRQLHRSSTFKTASCPKRQLAFMRLEIAKVNPRASRIVSQSTSDQPIHDCHSAHSGEC